MIELPDFEEMDELAEMAAHAKGRIKLLERVESVMSARFMSDALTGASKTYWKGGRHPTAVALEKVVAKIGNGDGDAKEMLDIAEEIATAYEQFEEYSAKLQTCRDKIGVYRTESANKRDARSLG